MNETITMPKAEYEALLDRLEDAEDLASIRDFDNDVEKRGLAAVLADGLGAEEMARITDGEHPLRIWRKHRKMTLDQLAVASGTGQSYLSEIETGRKNGSFELMAKLSRILRIDLDLLVPRSHS